MLWALVPLGAAGMNPLAGQALHPIPHNDCVVDGVGVDGNPSCKMWGWYWDGKCGCPERACGSCQCLLAKVNMSAATSRVSDESRRRPMRRPQPTFSALWNDSGYLGRQHPLSTISVW
jgi:hypothetical protein